ncbi:hypothetical protein GFY24_28810 [Nocardia sp. SYP-A9097]|uniref:DUF6928 family protein n=1 Tax=Nocardia sp. SYP-A9097 TaxID=2663237 RepID=UPI00129BE14B|nr:hypothetical protein [Nocardia sp. SYP-A9097]MRH91396.1 hypothetical protein [Nocardia sp. SYP-A9097]
MPSTVSSLWYVDASDPVGVLRAHPGPDPAAAWALARQLHPDRDVVPAASGTMKVWAGPDPESIYIGCYPGVTVVCSTRAALPRPTKLPELLVRPLASEHTYLVSYDLSLGWGAFAEWERGEFRRSFSASRVNILEDEGMPQVWERPYWAGEYPIELEPGELTDPQLLPFDPPDFAGAANQEWLGFRYRGKFSEDALTPDQIEVCGFSLFPKGEAPALDEPAAPVTAERNGKRGLFGWLRGKDRVS